MTALAAIRIEQETARPAWRAPARDRAGVASALPRRGNVPLLHGRLTLQGDMQGTSPFMGKVRFGCCVLDDGRGTLKAPDGTETVLRPKTLDLLRLMLRNTGRVVARQEILDAVWPNLFVTDDSITQCVVEIRKGMGGAGTDILKTVPRRGYLLTAEIEIEAANANAPSASATPRRDRASIAVLPFRQNAPDPQEAWFADGIIEGIIHVLAGVDGLTVIARSSALTLAEAALAPREAGRQLGVRYVLYGGVRRAGERLRITTELVETEGGEILRSDRYDGRAEDLFDLQDRIAEQVVTVVAPQVRERELSAALRKAPGNLTAYDLVLRALDRMKRDDLASMEQAGRYLQDAIAADPSYAVAHSYAALWHLLAIGEGWVTDNGAAVDEAARLSALAIERDPSDPLALATRGHAVAYLERDYAAAQRLLERAMRLGPSCPWAFAWGSLIASYLDDHAQAVPMAERALRLSPLDPFAYIFEHVLSQALLLAGDATGAVHWARRSFAASPRHMPNLRVLIVALAEQGSLAEARDFAAAMRERDPGFRLSAFAARTPLPRPYRDLFVKRLRQAGVAE